MRLYLSSQGLGGHVDRLLEMMGENRTVLFVDNAKDMLSAAERAEHVREKLLEFEQVGIAAEELDLRDYFISKEGLKERLQNVGLVFLSGGNTFVLRRALRYSGLDELLVEAALRDRYVLGGSSAGSIVLTPSLKGIQSGDSPDEHPAEYGREIIWDGLGLVDVHIVPHYLSDWFGSEAKAMAEYFQAHEMPYQTLMDGQVLVVDGLRREVLT